MTRANRASRARCRIPLGALCVLLAVCMACMGAYRMAQPAQAIFDGNGRHVSGVGAESVGGFWLGAYAAPGNGERRYPVWCTHMWRANPQPSDTASIDTLSESSRWGPDELDVTTAQMAWLLHEHQEDTSADNRAALSVLIHANFEREQKGRNTQHSVDALVNAVRTQLPGVYERAVRYVADSRASAVVGYESGLVEGDGMREGKIHHLGVMNEQGEWIAGRPMKVHLEGAAVFAENGQADWEGISGETPVSLSWKATDTGSVSAQVTFVNAVRDTLTVYGVNGKQDTVSYGDRPQQDREERTVPGPNWHVIYDFQPLVTTRVGTQQVVDGRIRDMVTAQADPTYGNGQWMNVEGAPVPVVFEGHAYYVGEHLPEEGEKIPEGAELLAMTTLTFHGSETLEARLDVPDMPSGFVTWVWILRRDQQGENSRYIHADWSDRYGHEEETSVIPYRVDIHSSSSLRHTRGGTYIVDDLFVSGFPQDHPRWGGGRLFGADAAEMTHTLYFFPDGLDVDDDHLKDAEKIGEVRLPARNGVFMSVGDGSFHVQEGRLGTYVFVTEFPGDGRVAPYRTPVRDLHEQYRPSQPPSDPPSIPPTEPPSIPPTEPPSVPPSMPPTLPPSLPPSSPPGKLVNTGMGDMNQRMGAVAAGIVMGVALLVRERRKRSAGE